MNKITTTIYRQLKSFMKAGKTWKPAENVRDKYLSKVVFVLSILLTLYLSKVVFLEEFVSGITKLRMVILLPLMFFVIMKFKAGVSFAWLIGGLKKYWIPTLMFLVLHTCLAGIVFMFITDNLIDEAVISFSAIAMLSLAIVFYSYFAGEVASLKKNETGEKVPFTSLSTDEKIKLGYSRFMKLLWICFLLGGIFGLLYAVGIADWFVVEILGW